MVQPIRLPRVGLHLELCPAELILARVQHVRDVRAHLAASRRLLARTEASSSQIQAWISRLEASQYLPDARRPLAGG